MKNPTPKSNKIDEVALELFYKYGFVKITIQDICVTAGVSRKTFYTYYKNKEVLVLSILTKIIEEAFDVIDQLMQEDTPFSEKMRKIIEVKLELSKSYSKEFVADFYHPKSEKILAFMEEQSLKSYHIVRTLLQNAQNSGDINPKLNIDFIMWIIQQQSIAVTTPEYISMFENVEDMVRQMSELFIYGILNKEMVR